MASRSAIQTARRLVWLLAICLLPGTAIGLTLNAEDLRQAAIAVDQDANEAVSFAAKDFQDNLLKMTGANLPIEVMPCTSMLRPGTRNAFLSLPLNTQIPPLESCMKKKGE